MKKIIWSFVLAAAWAGSVHADGCKVEVVEANTPAEKAGLKVGDMMVAANGHTIRTHEDLIKAVNSAGSSLRMVVQRGEKTDDINAELGPLNNKGPRLGVQCSYAGDTLQVQTRFVPEQSLSIGGGGAFPLSQLDTEFFGAGKQTIGGPGFVMNAQYLYGFSPRMDIGLEGAYTDLGGNEFNMGPSQADMSMQSTVVMAILRMHPPRTSEVMPYVLFGLGAHRSEFEWNLTPAPGYIWSSGTPFETRSIVSDKQTGVAVALGAGVEFDFSKNYFLSLEGRLDVIGENSYKANTFGNSVGLQSVDAGATNGLLMVRLGMRFGQTPAPPVPPAPLPAAEPAATTPPAPAPAPANAGDGMM